MNQETTLADISFAAKEYEKEKVYWLDKMSGPLEKSLFTYDNPQTAEPTYRGRTLEFQVDGPLYDKLHQLSTGIDYRLHMILTAAVVALLRIYTGHHDIIVGAPIYKQESGGDYLNTILALRHTIAEQETFKALLMQVRQTLAEATENQNYPIHTLLYQLNLPTEPGKFPLFDVVVLLENIHHPDYLGKLQPNIVFAIHNTGADLRVRLDYNASLYETESVELITRHYTGLLREALFNIDSPLTQLDYISPGEKTRLLEEFNRTENPLPADRTLHGLFQQQVQKTPQHIALMDLQNKLTYSEIDRNANRLAHALIRRGVRHGDVVGIIMERSVRMILTIFAILKAGGAYLVLDPNLPLRRMQTIIADSKATLLLTQWPQTSPVPPEPHAFAPAAVIPLETLDLQKSEMPDSQPQYTHREINPAYVIFTSGTTGKPKGVVIQHRNAVNTLACRKALYQMDTRHISLQLFSPSFDGFVTSFFTPIISGASVFLLTAQQGKDIAVIKEIIQKNRITHFISIPLLFQGIIESLTKEEAATLQVVTLAGDKITRGVLDQAQKKNPALEIVNEYGLTECSVLSTIYRNQQKDPRIKIGKPVWNSALYVLDRQMRPCGLGVCGELHIAGAGVARGYINEPQLTRERFIPNPFKNQSPHDALMYRTGDLARWLPDGNLEFFGRIDRQVKIRGNRVETAEIENRLLNHPRIKEGVVLAKDEAGGSGKELCAYFTADDNQTIDIEALRVFLREQLPDYMIPAYLLQLETLPYTPTGKIDHNALPDPKDAINLETLYEAPQNPTQEIVLGIWAGVLGFETGKIGIHDNFFQLGGNSISILKIQNQLNGEFPRGISMSEMFLAPTIAGMAASILKKEAQDSQLLPGDMLSDCIVRLNHGDNRENLFLIHPLHGMVYQYRELAQLLDADYNVYGIQGRGVQGEADLPGTIEEVVEDYLTQIRALQPGGPYLLGGYCIGTLYAYEITRHIEDAGGEVGNLLLFDLNPGQAEYLAAALSIKNKLAGMISRLPFISGRKGRPQSGDGSPPTESVTRSEAEISRVEARKKIIEENNRKIAAASRLTRVIRTPVCVLRASEDIADNEKTAPWDKLSKGPVTVVEIPGNHDTIFAQPAVGPLSETLIKLLASSA